MCYRKAGCQSDSCVLVVVHTAHIVAPPSVDTEKADHGYNLNTPIRSRACLRAFGLTAIRKKASDKNKHYNRLQM
jgi:hypothetical protein